MRILSIIITLLILLISCDGQKAQHVVYDDTISDTLSMKNVLEDTTKVLVVGMPVYLDSTDVLIHPIGWVDVYAASYKSSIATEVVGSRVSEKMYRGKTKDSNYSFAVFSNDQDYLSGEMVNLIFEDIETGKQRILTDKILIIRTARYLKNVAKEISQHYMFYSAYDKDYNRDGKLNYEDLEAYYMSNLDGTNFTKITQDYHYFDVSELILKNSKYYFRTIEDVNKDGEFNKKDKYHYYYIDLKKGDFTPIEYYPLALMNIE